MSDPATAALTTQITELTREQVESVLISPLEQQNVFLASGPRIFDSDGSQIRVPRLQGSTQPSWHGESERITETSMDWASVILLPSTLKSAKVLVRMSNELVRQSVIALEAALRDRLVFDVSQLLDWAFFSSDGAPTADGRTTPIGARYWDGTQDIAISGMPTVDDLHDAVGSALARHADPSVWFATPRDITHLRKLKDDYGRYLLEPDPTEGNAGRLLGLPVRTTIQLHNDPSDQTSPSTMMLADMSQVAVGRDLAPSVRLLDQTFGDFDETAIRVVTRWDSQPLNAEAVILLSGITPPA